MKLVVATGNKNKLLEFERILSPLSVEVLSPSDAGVELGEVDENAPDFEGNARIKALAMRELTGLAVAADDSGICVDALGGRPGVRSARYLGDAPQSEKNRALLQELENVPDEKRGASFVCAICCILEDGREISVTGECKGKIAYEPSGLGGFGYDPVFLFGEKSFGEMTGSEKDEISHRGIALRAFAARLAEHMQD